MKRIRTSLYTWLLTAFSAVLVPPLLAVVLAIVAVGQLAEDGERAVLDSVQAVDRSRAFVDDALALERHARRVRVLGDAESLALYETRRRAFRDTGAELSALPRADQDAVRHALAIESEAYATLSRAVEHGEDEALAASDADQAVEAVAQITAVAREELQVATLGVSDAAESFAERSQAVRQTLVAVAAVSVPLLLAVLALTGVVLIRPIRRLDRAIRALGDGDLDAPVRIRGPADVERLGGRLEWLRHRMLTTESDRVRLFRQVSHDLKTPLACIREATELLADGVPDAPTPGQQELLGILTKNSATLQTRIEGIVGLGELRQSPIALDVQQTDLSRLVGAVVTQHAVAARSGRVEIEATLPSAPCTVDAAKVEALLDNLVSNAIKFSPPGGRVVIEVASRPADSVHVIRVFDSGPGIAPHEQDRVFDAFYRAASADGIPGSGIGLSIAREHARAHGGDVWLDPQWASGACFVVELPTSPATPLHPDPSTLEVA